MASYRVGRTGTGWRRLPLALLAAAALFGLSRLDPATAQTPDAQFIPRLVVRTGPHAASDIPVADGYADYLDLLNNRDGGINGVQIAYEECETGDDRAKAVACYERLKHRGTTGAPLFDSPSTDITEALIAHASADKIPLVAMSDGPADAGDGAVFPYVFPIPTTAWSEADAIVQYIADREGGYAQLKDMRIGLLYLDAAGGTAPIPVLKKLAARYGFELELYPVKPPGLQQADIWLRIYEQNPTWMLMWGSGVMNAAAIKAAEKVSFALEHLIANSRSGDTADMKSDGNTAANFKATSLHGIGAAYPVIRDIFLYVYDQGGGHAERGKVGQVLYDQGVVNAIYDTEAIRTAQARFGRKPLTGPQVQWGFEHLNLTPARIRELGAEGLAGPVHLSCADHEGGGMVRIRQWDGAHWHFVSDWIPPPHRKMIREMYEVSALAYAKQNGITPRDCQKETAMR
jgi:branched-chain amino acid transport system substrate-binding protein